jgi:hypothetical protein
LAAAPRRSTSSRDGDRSVRERLFI